MKKFWSVLLAVSMLFGILPANFVWAASEPVVLFSYDFDDCVLGENIPCKADSLENWSKGAMNDVARLQAVEDAEHGRVAEYSKSLGSGAPRLEKVLYIDDMANMTVSFEAKNAGSDMKFDLYYADGSMQSIATIGSKTWVKTTVVFDFATGTYSVDGGTVKKLASTETSMLTLRFSASVVPGAMAYLDDVLITTTENVNPEHISNGTVGVRTPEEIIAPFAAYPKAPENTVPANQYKLFTYDGRYNANNGISTGTDVLWTGKSKAAPAIIQEDPCIRLTNDTRASLTGYLTKKVVTGNMRGTITLQYATVLAENGTYVTLKAGNLELANSKDAMITAQTPGMVKDNWNQVKAVFDFVNSQYSLYVNDTLVSGPTAFKASMPAEDYEVTIGICAKLKATSTALFDSFVIYQDVLPEVEGVKYFGTTGTTWSMVTEDVVLTQDSYVNNLRQHPRLLITDRQVILDKIANDPKAASWYASTKKNADNDLTKPVQAYEYSNGRNIKSEASVISGRITRAALVYLVEGDVKYFERGLAEIRNAGTFPDWSNASPILASGIMYSIACFYDWCYNSPSMTNELRKEIIQIVKDKALWQFARSYDGVISAEIAEGHTNRTTVANACGAGMAIAMADEEPELAQFLIDNAIKYTKQTVEAYSIDGAFAEGTSYWNYANDSMFNFLAQMDSATVEGYVKPAALQWYYDSERLINTPDYWAYMYGTSGNFDYGDSNLGFSAHPLIYWYSQRYNKPFYSWFLERTLQRIGSAVGSAEFALSYYDKDFESYNDGSMPLDKTFNAEDLAQVASVRSSWTAPDALFAAMQGGSNNASHMAKSLGTFVLDANGKRFVKQLGHVDYAALYDSDLYYMERAEGNNTIIANPGEEIDQNPNAIARFIAHGEAENEAFTVLDMTETNDAFTDAKRGMYMTKGRNSIVIQDEIKTNTPSEIWWFAHTEAEIALLDGGKSAIMDVDSEKMYVRITSGPEAAVFTVMEAEMLHPEIEAPDAEMMQNIVGQKLAIHLTDVSDLTLAVEFIPLRDGEGVPTAFTPVQAIADWSVSDNTISAKRQAGDAVVMLKDSPMAIAYESKVALGQLNQTITPFVQDGELYVPALRTAKLAYAKTEIVDVEISTNNKIKMLNVTRDYVTNAIAVSETLSVDGELYVPATTMATLLGMQLFTYENGLFAIADRNPNYSEENLNAVYTELNTCVYLNGELFKGFSTDKTTYSIANDIAMPTVRVTGGVSVEKTKDSASFTLNGTTYHFYRTDVLPAVNCYNVAKGKVMTADQLLGDSNPVERMTDGNLSTQGAVKRTNVTNVTFNLELGAPHYIERLELSDHRPDIASVVEKVVYKGRLEDDTWVELATIENLDANWTTGTRRLNVAQCTETRLITAIEMYLEDTDGSVDGKETTDRIHIYEFEVIGMKQSAPPSIPETYTTYEKKDGAYVFHTDIVAPPQSGYLLVSAYKGDAQVGMKIVPCTGKEMETYTLECAEFDTVRLVLLESFFTMRILSKPEIL